MSETAEGRVRGSFVSVESLEWWKNVFEISGVVLLLLTFIAGAGLFLFSRRLNAIQAEQLRQFDIDLTNAKTELGKQQERAADAELAAAEAKRIAGSFRLDIAQANKGAAEAQERAASANRIAEEERLKRVQIEERMKPRSLVFSEKVVSALARYKGTQYTFSSVFGDEESIKLLKQLDTALLTAKWTRVKPQHGFPAINVYGTVALPLECVSHS